MSSQTPQRKGVLHSASHRALSRTGIIAFVALIVSSFIGVILLTSPSILGTQYAAVVTSRLVALTNSDREESGLGTLSVSPVLTQAAQAKANDMAQKGYFAHVSPEGRTSWSWFKDAGYAFSYAGENLAVDFTDSGDVNEAWLNSPTHRANIMNGNFTQIGIATAEGEYQGHKTIFVVQMFGTPSKTAQPSRVVTVRSPENPEEVAIAKSVPSSEVLGTSVASEDKQESPAVESAAPPAHQKFKQEVSTPLPTSLLASPRILLRGIYIFFAAILLLALVILTRLEFKLHHARRAFAVLGLIVFMSGLFVTADHYVFVPPVIGEGVAQ